MQGSETKKMDYQVIMESRGVAALLFASCGYLCSATKPSQDGFPLGPRMKHPIGWALSCMGELSYLGMHIAGERR